MTITSTAAQTSLSARVAEEIRAVMGRRDMNRAELARRLNVSQMWVSDRLRGVTVITLNDLERIGDVLDVPAVDLFPGGGGSLTTKRSTPVAVQPMPHRPTVTRNRDLSPTKRRPSPVRRPDRDLQPVAV